MQTLPGDLPAVTAEILERLRARKPRVHCITNAVAQNFTANALLAAGAVPSMTLSADEIGGFVAKSDALLVNLGTFDAERRAAVDTALGADGQRPWVLDPVFIERSERRAAFARTLLARKPAAVRLNAAEFAALGEGVSDAAHFAASRKTAIAVSGATDRVTDGVSSVSIANGHPWMAKVTAMGCAGSALVAACLAVEADALRATAAAVLVLGVAGDVAAQRSAGPGSFAVAILDSLDALDRAAILRHAKVT